MLRSEEQVAQLVHDHQKLVQYEVNRYLKRYAARGMERDDLVSWGLLGLLHAARAWDPQRGAFSTVACRAIGWMLQRGAGREWKPDRTPVLSLDELMSGEEATGQSDRFLDHLADDQHLERELLEGETRAAIRSAVAELPPLERRLIERHFYEEIPITRVAEELGVSRQRAGERQRNALRRLRTTLDASNAQAIL